ncbi:MBL fold metallo-hydrolase [Actinomadura sp. LD22]|uniref:MBL fold metallo-hydrolase n=1 Tax=Actinomadura physcomitrii TaxID=2650748 RepID=A0A6I4MEF3_9ACTN|nr:MBL fold metallo-hydrolase [Actinomadura physcomitrii]MWA02925.1 MBL fold metallo-hydrolase [Actinomadura physcomitrii]
MTDAEPRTGRAGSGEWTRPTVERVAEGVHRVPLPLEGDALRAVNVYVLVHDGGATLIDSGWSFGAGMDTLEAALGTLDLSMSQIDRVLATHFHRDHYTLAVRMRQRFGTRIALGAGDRESVEGVLAGRSDGRRSWLRHWGAEALRPDLDALPAEPPSVYEPPDSWIEGPVDVVVGDRTLRAVPTPGHTRGHHVFADVDHGLLFAGDHVLPEITPSIGVEVSPAELPLGDFLSSLQLIRELPDLDLLPAHGPLGRRSHRRAGELLDHHRLRLAATRAAVGRGPRSAYEVARLLPWTRRERHFTDLDPRNRVLAVSETAAHLDVLVRDGALDAGSDDGVRVYTEPLPEVTPCAQP